MVILKFFLLFSSLLFYWEGVKHLLYIINNCPKVRAVRGIVSPLFCVFIFIVQESE
jgi:hypothetical protein